MQQNSNFKDEKLEDQIQQKENKVIQKLQYNQSLVQVETLLHSQVSNQQSDEKIMSLNIKISPQNTISFNSILPNDSLLSLLLRPNVTILEIFTHADFVQTLEQSNNSLIEKICAHMKEIIDFIKVEDQSKDERNSANKTCQSEYVNYFLLSHHAADVISSDQKEISYMFFPPKDKVAKNKGAETFYNLYSYKDQLLVHATSANESDNSYPSPILNSFSEQGNKYIKQSSFLEDVSVEPNIQKRNYQKSQQYLQTLNLSSSQQSNLQLLCDGDDEEKHQVDFLLYFLSLLFDFKTTSNSISISYFYQVFLNFFNRNMKEMEYYIFEKIPSFCDRLVCMVDDQTIMDLILLIINQPKQLFEVDAPSQSALPKDLLQEKKQDEEEIRIQFHFQKKCELIEGIFDNLQNNFQNQQIIKNSGNNISTNADASSALPESQNIDEKQKQKSESICQEQNLEQDILFWKMKNSSMIICEILDHFQDINRGEDLGFYILNYHSQKVFQSLSSNNIDEISFNSDVAQHLLAFLQNEDIQFRIEFETIKGNKIVEKYFKESIISIKRELNLAQQKKIDSFDGQFGEKIAMFQAHRLKLIKLIELAFSFKIKEVVQEIFDQEILQIIIVLFFQYEWNNQLHLNVLHLFETIIEVAQQNDNPSWIFYIIKRVKLVNYIISNSEVTTRRITNPVTHVTKVIQKSYIGHLKKLAESVVKCIEQNSHYECWIEDQNKWADLNKMVQVQQKILKGKLGEEEQPSKQKFQLNCNAKQSLLNRRKQLIEGKKESEKQNNTGNSSKNQDVFQRLNSPIKKTITLQVGTPKQKPNQVDEEERGESVSSLQSKKEQQQQVLQKLQLDSPMLKSKNHTPKLGSSSSLLSSQSLGIRTPKTPVLSTPTRAIQNAPATPNMKKIFLSSPMKKPDNQLKSLEMLDQIKLSNDENIQNNNEKRGRKKNRNWNTNVDEYSNEDELDSLNSSNSSVSSADSQKSRSSSNGNSEKNYGWKFKPKEFHTYLLKDLDQITFEDQSQVLTQKHSIKINEVGFSFLNKKEKKLFDWNQKAEDEEEELKQMQRQEECFKELLQDSVKQPSIHNLFNLEAAAAIQQKREFFSSMINFSYQNLESSKNSACSSPNKSNQTPKIIQENYKKNSIDEISSPRVLKESPYQTSKAENTIYRSPNLRKRSFNDSPCIEVNKQYFGYLVRDKIRKFSYDTQVDPKIKQVQTQAASQVKSCPQSQAHQKLSLFSDEINKKKSNLISFLNMKEIQRSRESRHSFDLNFLQINGQIKSNKSSIYKNDLVKSVDSLSYQKKNQVNSKLIKQVRDNLDNSDDSQSLQKSRECLSDEKLSLKNLEKANIGCFQSEISSEDEKVQQRTQFLGRKQVKKKSTFYQQMKEIKIMDLSNLANQKIEEELQLGSNQLMSDEPHNNVKSMFSKKNIFSQQSSEEKILNKKIKTKVHNMNIENQDKESYGDLEDTSPLIKRSTTTKLNIGSEKKVLSNKSNKSHKSQVNEQNNISSQTSIQDRLEGIHKDDHQEISLLKANEDVIFLNLISGDEEIAQKNGNWQITIANTIMQKSQRMQKSFFSKNSNSQLNSPNIQKSDEQSQYFMFNSENNQQRLSSSSSSYISLSIQNNKSELGSNFCSNLQQDNKSEIAFEKIPRSNSNTNIVANYSNEKEDLGDPNEEDLILKILLKQQNNHNSSLSIAQTLRNSDQLSSISNINNNISQQEQKNSQSHQ
ncbi:hypothetical protein TTHERM_00309910 (macronuclear) [Tetrahymena thermophila SB210]|uniref:Uncharacterized protein n=1 Tax=Tetrahymena thermophila (strain SB210) TaxID=312017 RepID=I7M2M5_TETTS|nr:hypothetical protein TTHERM_00309910 [Tetrahymena thermophila SB210]EAS00822.2 hypothetical protein TTHERM_00309910 [Tetrahymena thermophila SB210]|eukprot:XP_001021067.2 hypothetical protein TTHERM_00309910 [Tetrahymena thermophila SB210]